MINDKIPQNNFLLNLSMLVNKPTGITNYINNILPYLIEIDPICLAANSYYLKTHNSYQISEKLSPDYGSKGHFLRLMWTQFKLPLLYKKLNANLLFSPVPEAPLYNKNRSIIMVHDLIPIRFPKRQSPLTPYFRYYIPQVCQQAEHIICNSQATANDIVNYFNISAKKITPIHLSYNEQIFRPLILTNKANKTPYFLFLGRHDPHKNVSRIIEAFAKIPHNKNYQLWLAGPSDVRYTPLLKQQAIELGIKNQVKFLDYVCEDDLPKIMGEAIALVFTTLWEGFGFPILEAMACGTPVITSNVSSLPEVAGDAAILVNPHDSQKISEAMELIIKDETMRSQLTELGLKRVKDFSWEKTGKETLNIIKKYTR